MAFSSELGTASREENASNKKSHCHCFTTMAFTSLPRSSTISGTAVINRRHALGLLASAGILPSRSFANVSYQRSEFRDALAKRFFDLGTEGTFVGYKVDDYLIIASDKVRSGEAKLPASTFKIPNSIVALETGVVEDPDKEVFKGAGGPRR